MKRFLLAPLALAAILLPSVALAWHVQGQVFCANTGQPLAGIRITVESTTPGFTFVDDNVSDQDGHYFIDLPALPACYRLTATTGAGEAVVTPASGEYTFCTSDAVIEFIRDWVISSPRCTEGACWLTGGGAKVSAIAGIPVAEKGRRHNFGGNVNPGCSPTAGDGGNWNHIDDDLKLHFQGQHIEVIRCGNVDGIPPGSTSPRTPFNFIEFQGTGRVQGVKGNKADFPLVYFFGRCEDRNEPGSNGQRDGAGKDRYFLKVYTDPSNPNGSTIMLIDDDGNPATVDPTIITDGNLQIHVSSCDFAATFAQPTDNEASRIQVPAATPHEVSLALMSTSPLHGPANLRFGLPREMEVSLAVFDVTGRKVSQIVAGRLPAGEHNATWNLLGPSGKQVGGGVYFIRMQAGTESFSRPVVVR
jgi:hypothetical protein